MNTCFTLLCPVGLGNTKALRMLHEGQLQNPAPVEVGYTNGNSNISVCAKTHGKIQIPTEKYFSDDVPSENNTQK